MIKNTSWREILVRRQKLLFEHSICKMNRATGYGSEVRKRFQGQRWDPSHPCIRRDLKQGVA